MLAFCRKCLGADFVSIFTYSRTCVPALVGTATTTAADNARKAAMGYMQHFASGALEVALSALSARELQLAAWVKTGMPAPPNCRRIRHRRDDRHHSPRQRLCTDRGGDLRELLLA